MATQGLQRLVFYTRDELAGAIDVSMWTVVVFNVYILVELEDKDGIFSLSRLVEIVCGLYCGFDRDWKMKLEQIFVF